MNSMLTRAAALLMVSCLAACAGTERPGVTLQSLRTDAIALRAQERALQADVVDKLVTRTIARGDRTLDLLLLSGGGQNGAYGIGFLRGWRERGDAQAMPRFDLVTGISTGALQAPYALLGTEQALDESARLYLSAASDFAPTVDWLFWARRTGGLVDTGRYREALAGAMGAGLRDRLQPEFAAGRQLLVGTADHDLGIGRTWDLGRELAAGDAGLARMQQVLLAATAIPGVFPPQTIDGHLHSDGGVVANVLTVLDLAGYRRLAERLRARGVAGEVTVRVWVVLNFWTHPKLVVMDPGNRSAIAQRGNALLFGLAQPQLLQRLDELALAVSAGVPGLRLQVRYTALPSSLANEPGADKLFDAAWMTRIEQLGRERARGATPWDQVASPYERPEETAR